MPFESLLFLCTKIQNGRKVMCNKVLEILIANWCDCLEYLTTDSKISEYQFLTLPLSQCVRAWCARNCSGVAVIQSAGVTELGAGSSPSCWPLLESRLVAGEVLGHFWSPKCPRAPVKGSLFTPLPQCLNVHVYYVCSSTIMCLY